MSQELSDLARLWASSHSDASEPARSIHEQVCAWYQAWAGEVTHALVMRFGRADDAQDATQEAFLRLLEVRLSGEVVDAPKAWLMTVARRLMINRGKEDDKYALPLEAEYNDPIAATHEDAHIVRERVESASVAVRELSDLERCCLAWRAQGWKLRAIAEHLSRVAPELGPLDHRRVSEILARAVRHVRQRIRT